MSQKKKLTLADFWEIKHETDELIKCLGWSKNQAIEYILKHYGKSTRLAMSDEDLLHLRTSLKNMPRPTTTPNSPSIRTKRSRRRRI